ncbi:MAG: DUF502 domain-containing protein [Gammaproteobacteria bacterium]
MLGSIGRNILTGLITILPVMLTLYLLYGLVVSTESVLGAALRNLLPDGAYRPGMGVAAGLATAFIVGLLMHTLLMRRLVDFGERLVFRLPVVKSVYVAIRDFFGYFSPERKKEFEQVVVASVGDTGMELIGFVTQADPQNLPEDCRRGDNILVYFPMSYMIGGYAVLLPRSAVRPVNLSMEEAMRFILTAGVTGAISSRTPADDRHGR